MRRLLKHESTALCIIVAAAGCTDVSSGASSPLPARTAFVPDDPMLAPGPATRDGWGQWHLQNRMPVSSRNAGLDINVAPAWERGLTGRGVVVGVVDQAPQVNHPDLAPNYRADLSRDFSKANAGDVVRPSDSEHGTQCAGLIAARGGNGIGVSGVAPEAQWAALAAGTGLPVKQVAAATTWRLGEIDILNFSLAYMPTMHVEEIERAVEQACARGTLVVRAAGNTRGGFATDDCTAQGLSSQADAIVVAAIGSDGRFASYSSYGAAVVCCAPSDSQFDEPPPRRPATTTQATTVPASTRPSRPSLGGVLTTKGPAGYARFGGTSAAAPVVAGTLALVRQARNDAGGLQGNPSDWSRYIKHLLARTCRVIDEQDRSETSNANADLTRGAGWVTNAAGYRFNANYGFGLIDADALTRAAERYAGVTPLHEISAPEQRVDVRIPDGDGEVVRRFELVGDRPLETVSVTLRVEHTSLRHLEVFLRSPTGTVSQLLNRGRETDTKFNVGAISNIPLTLTSHAFWGERPGGTWELTVRDVKPTKTGTWKSFHAVARCGNILEATQTR